MRTRWRSFSVALLVVAGILAPGGARPAGATVIDATTITPIGAVTHVRGAAPTNTSDVVTGPDGNLWILTDHDVWRVTPAGVFTRFEGLALGGEIVVGPDGALWFTGHGAIGRMTVDGVLTTFTAPGIDSPYGLTTGADGNLWFADYRRETIGRLTPAGVFTAFDDPAFTDLWSISTGPDGTLWFGAGEHGVGRRSPDGTITIHTDAALSFPRYPVATADGVVWFANRGTDEIGRLATDGTLTFTSLPGLEPFELEIGPDGRPWFTSGTKIGRVKADASLEVVVDAYPAGPSGLTVGPDGRMWFTSDRPSGSLFAINPDGTLDRFVANDVAGPDAIATGPDGSIWFTDPEARTVGRVDPAGALHVVAVPGFRTPHAVVVAADGVAWFTADDSTIGRVTPAGVVTILADTVVPNTTDLKIGPDGNLWLAGGYAIARVTPAGVATSFPIEGDVRGITAGPDGNLWFTRQYPDGVGRITPGGVVTTWDDERIARPAGITTGPDGALWFTNTDGHSVGRVTTDGALTFVAPAGIGFPLDIVVGPDHNLWLTNPGSSTYGSVARLTGGGELTNFASSTLDANRMTTGLDGGVWFTERWGIGRVQASCGDHLFADILHEHPFCTAITWMAGSGISHGFPDGTFRPAQDVERQALAAFLYRNAGEPPVVDLTPFFADVGDTNPFFDAIQWMGQTGRSLGSPNPGGKPLFQPNAPVTRQAMAAFLYRDAGSPANTLPVTLFADVPPSHPFFVPIQWLTQRGIASLPPVVVGAPPTFRPSDAMSRQAAASFLFERNLRVR